MRKEIYYEYSSCMIMEAEKSPCLLSVSWRLRKTDSVIIVQDQRPENLGNWWWKCESKVDHCPISSRQAGREGVLPPSTFVCLFFLLELDDATHIGEGLVHESTDSNAHLVWKHPNRHTRKCA